MGFHGVFPHEKLEGKEFLCDIVLAVDTRNAAMTDELAYTVDYGAVAQAAVDVIQGEPVRLIETLAERIAAVALQQPLVQAVEVSLHKPHAPIPVPFDDVVVTILRSR
jgi:dihydroneopterin aldolase